MMHKAQDGRYPQEFYDRASKQIAKINQFFSDVKHWNDTHPNEKINPDPDGQLRMLKRNARLTRREKED